MALLGFLSRGLGQSLPVRKLGDGWNFLHHLLTPNWLESCVAWLGEKIPGDPISSVAPPVTDLTQAIARGGDSALGIYFVLVLLGSIAALALAPSPAEARTPSPREASRPGGCSSGW
jgi:hypothetical protein